MGDDLDAGLAQPAEQVLAPEVDLAADGIDRQPDLDAGRDLRRPARQEGLADVARLVAVDEQVDVVGRGRDVLEHPREVAPAVEERLDRRRDRRREGLGEVGAADARPGDELGRADRRVLGADGVRVERVGRDRVALRRRSAAPVAATAAPSAIVRRRLTGAALFREMTCNRQLAPCAHPMGSR